MNIQRCQTDHILKPHSVATHSYYVVALAMLIGDEISSRFDFSMELLLRKAVLHDMEEAITGDIIYPVKHATPELNQVLVSALEELSSQVFERDFPHLKGYQILNETAKEGIEGAIVELADRLELLLYCWEEKNMGNELLNHVYLKARVLVSSSNLFKASELARKIYNQTGFSITGKAYV